MATYDYYVNLAKKESDEETAEASGGTQMQKKKQKSKPTRSDERMDPIRPTKGEFKKYNFLTKPLMKTITTAAHAQVQEVLGVTMKTSSPSSSSDSIPDSEDDEDVAMLSQDERIDVLETEQPGTRLTWDLLNKATDFAVEAGLACHMALGDEIYEDIMKMTKQLFYKITGKPLGFMPQKMSPCKKP